MNLLFEHPASAPAPAPRQHLRPYQEDAVQAVEREWSSNVSTLVVMATGLGKTQVFAEAVRRRSGMGRAIVLAHRQELIDQAADRIRRVCGLRCDIEMGDRWADMGGARAPVVVSSIQTQISGRPPRMERFDPMAFSTLIIDECHHATASTYRRVIDHYRRNPSLRVLGVTATPDRADESSLGQIFESVAYVHEITDGIEGGWLVPIRQRSVIVKDLDFSNISTSGDDLNGGELAELMEYEEEMHGLVSSCVDLVGDRQTIIFASSVAHAERICEILNRHSDGCARFVTGTTPALERRRIFSDYAGRHYQFLVNVGVVTEGVDVPGIEVVVMGRPTKSRSLYAQMVGRGTRPLPGLVDGLPSSEHRRVAIASSRKPFVEVIDFVGNAGRHKLISTADILGGEYDDEVVDRAKAIAQESEEPIDAREALERAKREVQEVERKKASDEAEKRRRAHVKGIADYSTAIIDAFDAFDLEPQRLRGWDRGNLATEKQVAILVRESGGTITEEAAAQMSRKHASQLIDRYFAKPTEKQARQLRRFGLPDDVSKPVAGRLMAAIVAAGWQRPDPATIESILGHAHSGATVACSDPFTVVDGSEVDF